MPPRTRSSAEGLSLRRVWPWAVAALLLVCRASPAEPPRVEPWRLDLGRAWRRLAAPPITPYSGPFGGEARAFIGRLPRRSPVRKDYYDWKRLGTYDPARDPRPINRAYERAVLEDWRRMGYNAAFKGKQFTYRSGRWLKRHGLLGAIDQTLWGEKGDPPLAWDGTPGRRFREACRSFFAPANYRAGVETLVNFVRHHGDLDMVRIGGTYITCSWDEVGIRTRSMIDYRPQALSEYRRYLREVWFQDDSPARDTNGDGRTYNRFAGEHLTTWDEVHPPRLSPAFYKDPKPTDEKWSRLGAYKLWLDFHRYFTFEFFRRINAEASARLGPGRRVECYPFPQAFIIWPGANAFMGLGMYWNARLNPIINIEQCWPDSPAMVLNYAQADRLSRRFGNVVMGWSWFWPADEAHDLYGGPGDIERALARMMGHRVDGIHHWLYSPQYRGRHRRQRRQLAYWHNFLAKHYAAFLARSEPLRAQVALLTPDTTGYFYRKFQYPKMDYAYTAMALVEAQIPFEVVAEEELELDPDALRGYRLLYVVGSEWATPAVRRRIREFVAGGGRLFVNADSLSLDVPTGRRTTFLEALCGVRLRRKHKNPFYPSAETAAEERWAARLNAWKGPLSFQGRYVREPSALSRLWKRAADGKVVRNEAVWEALDLLLRGLPRTGRGGLPQRAIDMRRPPAIRYAKHLRVPQNLTTYGEINTAEAVGGKPIAWYGKAVCGVETERTVWLGTRPGMSLHALAPRKSRSRTSGPVNPFVVEVPDPYESHRPYVDLIAYATRKAGLRPPVALTRRGRTPCNLEVLPRADDQGNLMVVVVNHDATAATCDVDVAATWADFRLANRSTAWNVLEDEVIERNTDGRFRVRVPPYRPAVFFVGSTTALQRVREAQARLAAMDLSVPRYFLERPQLNTPRWDTPIPAE